MIKKLLVPLFLLLGLSTAQARPRIYSNGTLMPDQPRLKLIGAGILSCADNAGGASTDCTWVAGGGATYAAGSGLTLTGTTFAVDPTIVLTLTGTQTTTNKTIDGTTNTFVNVPQTAVTNLVSNLAGKVPTTRQVNTGSCLTGGGALTADLTLNFAALGVGAGTYGTAGSSYINTITINACGQITAIATGTPAGGGGGVSWPLTNGTSTNTYTSAVANGSTAVAHAFDSTNTLSTAGSKLFSFRNATLEKLYIAFDGALGSPGTLIIGDANTNYTQLGKVSGATVSTSYTGELDIATNGTPQVLFYPYTVPMLGTFFDHTVAAGSVTRHWHGVHSDFWANAMGSALTAATTVTPTYGLHHVTGATTINTIATTNFVGNGIDNVEFTMIADTAIAWSAAGNISVAGSLSSGATQKFYYDTTATKWYPQQVGASGGGSGTVTNVTCGTGLTGGTFTTTGTCAVDTTIATLTGTQTLTGKTLTGASNTITGLPESATTNLVSDLAAKAVTTRLVSTGAGLTGGGDLSADRTITTLLNASGGLTKTLGAGTNELGIASTGVTNAMLTNSSLTVNTTGPLAGGGAVALGSSITLSCPTCGTTWPLANGTSSNTYTSGQTSAATPAHIFDTGLNYTAANSISYEFRDHGFAILRLRPGTFGQTALEFADGATGTTFAKLVANASMSFLNNGGAPYPVVTGPLTAVGSIASGADLTYALGTSTDRRTEIWARRHAGVTQTIAAAATITIDPASGESIRVVLGATAITTVSGAAGYPGETINVEVIQDATGGRSISGWSASANGFLFLNPYTTSTAANARDLLQFTWDTVLTQWVQTNQTVGSAATGRVLISQGAGVAPIFSNTPTVTTLTTIDVLGPSAFSLNVASAAAPANNVWTRHVETVKNTSASCVAGTGGGSGGASTCVVTYGGSGSALVTLTLGSTDGTPATSLVAGPTVIFTLTFGDNFNTRGVCSVTSANQYTATQQGYGTAPIVPYVQGSAATTSSVQLMNGSTSFLNRGQAYAWIFNCQGAN